jgi:hypothetical protein
MYQPASVADSTSYRRRTALTFNENASYRNAFGTRVSAFPTAVKGRLADAGGIVTGYMDYHTGANPNENPNREDPRTGNLQQIRREKFLGFFNTEWNFPVAPRDRYIERTAQWM